jgi:L-seryl-tRNA(Ser) seleniumtransferase
MGPGDPAVFKTVGCSNHSGRFDSCLFRMYETLPQVEALLQHPSIEKWFVHVSRPVAADVLRITIEEFRKRIGTEQKGFDLDEIVSACEKALATISCQRLQQVINATGVIIHTNLGRAPISRENWERVGLLNYSYTNLEFDVAKGKRGKRSSFTSLLLTKMSGAEDALVVNNNAAAIFLILSAFAKRKEVIVSRSELVQIGGGFRIPDILKASGAKLVEVGTTNITTLADYLDAINEKTAMVLRVHRSNFALRGFTEEVGVRDLKQHLPSDLLLVVDQGSGVFDPRIPSETTVGRHIASGADLVSFSADKALGSVQAGCVVGKRELVAKLGKHPLFRTMRIGKTVSSLLEATLIDLLNGVDQPVGTLLFRSVAEMRKTGSSILERIKSERLSLIEDTMTLGGGSTPDESLPSLSIRLASSKPQKDAQGLRLRPIPIITTIHKGAVHINLGTVMYHETEELVSALTNLVEAP